MCVRQRQNGKKIHIERAVFLKTVVFKVNSPQAAGPALFENTLEKQVPQVIGSETQAGRLYTLCLCVYVRKGQGLY